MLALARSDDATATAPGRTARGDLLAGARAMGPWLLGVVPFGLVIGVSIASSNLPAAAGWLTGPLLYAGSSQVAAIGLLDAGAAPLVVVLAVAAINLRLVLYSATMVRHWHQEPRHRQALFAYLLVDPSMAVGVDGYAAAGDVRRGHRHYLGGAIVLWVAWLAAITVGLSLGTSVPDALRLDLVIPLFLVGELVPRLGGRTTNLAVGAAATVAIAGSTAPLHLGPLLAMVAGLGVALRWSEAER